MSLRALAVTLTVGFLVAGQTVAVGGFAVDQAVTLTYGSTHWSGEPAADLAGVDPTGDPLFHSGFWYRISGDTREYPLPPPSSETYADGMVVARWNNLDGKGFALEERTFVQDGEGPSGGFWTFVWVTNNTAAAAEFTLFHYLDPDVAASATGDLGALVTPDFLEFADGGSWLSYRGNSWHYQLAPYPALRDLLNDASLTTLSDAGAPFGPGDATAAFQFGPWTIQPGATYGLASVSATFNPARRHVKGDTFGLGLTTLLGQATDLSNRGAQPMRRTGQLYGMFPTSAPTTNASVAGVDDFDGDHRDEIAFRDLLDGSAFVGFTPIAGAPTLALNWKLSATGDFSGDGKADILWRNTTSQKLVIWTMNGSAKTGNILPSPDQAVDANWEVAAAADFNGDGTRDLLWYNQTSGKIVLWFMNTSVVRTNGQFTNPSTVGNNNWKVLAVGDFGKGPGGVYDTQDIVWQNDTSKKVVVWFMDLAGNRTSGTFTSPDTLFLNYDLVGPR